MGLEEIVVSLNTLGITHTILATGPEGGVLVLPDYGRVLGVWPHWRGENALWVNPEFLQQLRIGAKDDGWLNPGGDRIWIAPEEEFFPDGQEIPPAIDPGHFALAPEKTGCHMESRGEARAWKTGARVRFRISRKVRPLDDARLGDAWGKTWLRQAGYEEETTLDLEGGCACPVRLWNITQVRAGAEVRVPLRRYWGDTALSELPPGSVGLADNCAVVCFQGNRSIRVAVDAADAGSRIICLEERELGRAQLLVKDFSRESRGDPRAAHVECRWKSQDDFGEFSCFSPAIGPHGKKRLQWKTSLSAFSGRTEAVRAFAARISS